MAGRLIDVTFANAMGEYVTLANVMGEYVTQRL